MATLSAKKENLRNVTSAVGVWHHLNWAITKMLVTGCFSSFVLRPGDVSKRSILYAVWAFRWGTRSNDILDAALEACLLISVASHLSMALWSFYCARQTFTRPKCMGHRSFSPLGCVLAGPPLHCQWGCWQFSVHGYCQWYTKHYVNGITIFVHGCKAIHRKAAQQFVTNLWAASENFTS